MKKLNTILGSLLVAAGLSSCSMFGLDVQKDYEYKKSALDAHINMSARQYLESRGKNPVIAGDSIFKWMQLGLEYAGINLDEYEKPGRTFVFLSNGAIRVLPTKTVGGVVVPSSIVPTGGMWFTFPITQRNPDGSPKVTNNVVETKPATKWEEYSKADVQKYFLYLIAIGDYGFNNAQTLNTSLPSLLAPGMSASDSSRLGFFTVGTEQDLNATGNRVVTFVNARVAGTNYGFDPEGKINFKILNSDYSPLQINDFHTVTTAGLIATNGQIHVYAPTGTTPVPLYPYRY
ncbi:MAG TPA: hypothetical protein VK541_00305 [Pedobacter sp.]|uniref:hypothetical protein n=1 Tax=Pedobacter sp. TaxID=1411316 RepID=UPI002C110D8D|nr:hypothetical protein [Pedobacter sp.]HMI00885.1 hypothetical protein [Pedobacter sp.]